MNRLEQEGRWSVLKKMFRAMRSTEKKADILVLLEKFIHSTPKRIENIQVVIDHMESGEEISSKTIIHNLKALLKATKSHDELLLNIACICMMTVMSKQWNDMSMSASGKCGETNEEQLQELMGKIFRGKR